MENPPVPGFMSSVLNKVSSTVSHLLRPRSCSTSSCDLNSPKSSGRSSNQMQSQIVRRKSVSMLCDESTMKNCSVDSSVIPKIPKLKKKSKRLKLVQSTFDNEATSVFLVSEVVPNYEKNSDLCAAAILPDVLLNEDLPKPPSPRKCNVEKHIKRVRKINSGYAVLAHFDTGIIMTRRRSMKPDSPKKEPIYSSLIPKSRKMKHTSLSRSTKTNSSRHNERHLKTIKKKRRRQLWKYGYLKPARSQVSKKDSTSIVVKHKYIEPKSETVTVENSDEIILSSSMELEVNQLPVASETIQKTCKTDGNTHVIVKVQDSAEHQLHSENTEDSPKHSLPLITTGKEQREEVDGLEFYCFENENDLAEFTSKQVQCYKTMINTSDSKKDNVPLIVMPSKTHNIKSIKGWKNKVFILDHGLVARRKKDTDTSTDEDAIDDDTSSKAKYTNSVFANGDLDEYLTPDSEINISSFVNARKSLLKRISKKPSAKARRVCKENISMGWAKGHEQNDKFRVPNEVKKPGTKPRTSRKCQNVIIDHNLAEFALSALVIPDIKIAPKKRQVKLVIKKFVRKCKSDFLHRKMQGVKLSKVERELYRLGATVIDCGSSCSGTSTTQMCNKLYCRLGCICESLQAPSYIRDHCGKVECMLECVCIQPRYLPIELKKLSLLTNQAIARIEEEQSQDFAKEEKESKATVIKKDSVTMVQPRGKREHKLPQRLRDSSSIILGKEIGSMESLQTNYVDAGLSYNNKRKPRKCVLPSVTPCSIEVLRWNKRISSAGSYCLEHDSCECDCLKYKRNIALKRVTASSLMYTQYHHHNRLRYCARTAAFQDRNYVQKVADITTDIGEPLKASQLNLTTLPPDVLPPAENQERGSDCELGLKIVSVSSEGKEACIDSVLTTTKHPQYKDSSNYSDQIHNEPLNTENSFTSEDIVEEPPKLNSSVYLFATSINFINSSENSTTGSNHVIADIEPLQSIPESIDFFSVVNRQTVSWNIFKRKVLNCDYFVWYVIHADIHLVVTAAEKPPDKSSLKIQDLKETNYPDLIKELLDFNQMETKVDSHSEHTESDNRVAVLIKNYSMWELIGTAYMKRITSPKRVSMENNGLQSETPNLCKSSILQPNSVEVTSNSYTNTTIHKTNENITTSKAGSTVPVMPIQLINENQMARILLKKPIAPVCPMPVRKLLPKPAPSEIISRTRAVFHYSDTTSVPTVKLTVAGHETSGNITQQIFIPITPKDMTWSLLQVYENKASYTVIPHTNLMVDMNKLQRIISMANMPGNTKTVGMFFGNCPDNIMMSRVQPNFDMKFGIYALCSITTHVICGPYIPGQQHAHITLGSFTKCYIVLFNENDKKVSKNFKIETLPNSRGFIMHTQEVPIKRTDIKSLVRATSIPVCKELDNTATAHKISSTANTVEQSVIIDDEIEIIEPPTVVVPDDNSVDKLISEVLESNNLPNKDILPLHQPVPIIHQELWPTQANKSTSSLLLSLLQANNNSNTAATAESGSIILNRLKDDKFPLAQVQNRKQIQPLVEKHNLSCKRSRSDESSAEKRVFLKIRRSSLGFECVSGNSSTNEIIDTISQDNNGQKVSTAADKLSGSVPSQLNSTPGVVSKAALKRVRRIKVTCNADKTVSMPHPDRPQHKLTFRNIEQMKLFISTRFKSQIHQVTVAKESDTHTEEVVEVDDIKTVAATVAVKNNPDNPQNSIPDKQKLDDNSVWKKTGKETILQRANRERTRLLIEKLASVAGLNPNTTSMVVFLEKTQIVIGNLESQGRQFEDTVQELLHQREALCKGLVTLVNDLPDPERQNAMKTLNEEIEKNKDTGLSWKKINQEHEESESDSDSSKLNKSSVTKEKQIKSSIINEPSHSLQCHSPLQSLHLDIINTATVEPWLQDLEDVDLKTEKVFQSEISDEEEILLEELPTIVGSFQQDPNVSQNGKLWKSDID